MELCTFGTRAGISSKKIGSCFDFRSWEWICCEFISLLLLGVENWDIRHSISSSALFIFMPLVSCPLWSWYEYVPRICHISVSFSYEVSLRVVRNDHAAFMNILIFPPSPLWITFQLLHKRSMAIPHYRTPHPPNSELLFSCFILWSLHTLEKWGY